MIATLWFFGILIGFFAVFGGIPVLLIHAGRRQLARQIVEHTTNAFGTMEWRVVEVEEGME